MARFAAATVLALLAIPAVAFSQSEMQRLRPLPITMSAAVHAAEAATPGQAVAAQLGTEEGRPVYVVDVIDVQNKTMTVQVDAQNGRLSVVGAQMSDMESAAE
jgi:uncharacterized membrane protein YkoI